MHNNSIETLLLRHYGDDAPTPPQLEPRLTATLQNEMRERERQESRVAQIRAYKVSRRRAVQLVALSSAGLSILSAGLEGLQMIENNLISQDVAQPAMP